MHQAPVVRKVDSAIQWINYYLLHSAIDLFSLYVFVLTLHKLCAHTRVNKTKFERNSSLEYMTCIGKTKKYKLKRSIGFCNTYPLDSAIQLLNNRGQIYIDTLSRRGSTSVSTALQKSVRFFIINVLLINRKLSKF